MDKYNRSIHYLTESSLRYNWTPNEKGWPSTVITLFNQQVKFTANRRTVEPGHEANIAYIIKNQQSYWKVIRPKTIIEISISKEIGNFTVIVQNYPKPTYMRFISGRLNGLTRIDIEHELNIVSYNKPTNYTVIESINGVTDYKLLAEINHPKNKQYIDIIQVNSVKLLKKYYKTRILPAMYKVMMKFYKTPGVLDEPEKDIPEIEHDILQRHEFLYAWIQPRDLNSKSKFAPTTIRIRLLAGYFEWDWQTKDGLNWYIPDAKHKFKIRL